LLVGVTPVSYAILQMLTTNNSQTATLPGRLA